MASGNLDLVRSIHAAWDRGDFGAADWAHPEIEYVHADGPVPGSWTGLAAMAEGWRSFLRTWEGFRTEATDYRELDGDRVLVLARFGGRGKTSGVELGRMRTNSAALFHVQNGKVTRLVIYWDGQRAVADVGLGTGSSGA
jgi:ketosteroid isomerase-like protein